MIYKASHKIYFEFKDFFVIVVSSSRQLMLALANLALLALHVLLKTSEINWVTVDVAH